MDPNPFIKCICGNIMREDEFTNHFQKCESFKNHFKNFDTSFGSLLKTYSEPVENLLIIRVLLKQYISVIERKIIQKIPPMEPHKNIIFPPLNEPPIDVNKQNNYVNQNMMNPYQPQNQQPFQQSFENQFGNPNKNPYAKEFESVPPLNDIEICPTCGSPDIILHDECFQVFSCKMCFIKNAEANFPNMKCGKCNQLLSEFFKKQVLGDAKYEELETKFTKQLLGNIVECPWCKEKNTFEKGKVDYKVKDDQNRIISRAAAEDYAANRCRCGRCQKDFCVSCHKSPYHIGKTCKEAEVFEKALKCRYCETVITMSNRGPDPTVCNSQECKERYNISCKKILPCGHKCFGCANENICPPCLVKDCKGYKNLFDQDEDSYCNICYCEGLGAAPVVLLSCNHFAHYHCILKRLSSRWVGPKITFNHCLCPSCNNWYNCPSIPIIQNHIDTNKKLYETICDMALKRLKFEDLDKDEKLVNPNSPWYGKKLEYALKRLSYYECYTCKKPYFAGRRECGDGPGVNENNPNKPYDPKELLCGTHSNLSGVAGVSNCPKHGKEFIEYKCRFCCKVASWFCWGTTHFCEDCHQRQCNGDYVSKYRKDQLPKCNPATCELKVKHPPNGEEFALGCSICRNAEENRRDF